MAKIKGKGKGNGKQPEHLAIANLLKRALKFHKIEAGDVKSSEVNLADKSVTIKTTEGKTLIFQPEPKAKKENLGASPEKLKQQALKKALGFYRIKPKDVFGHGVDLDTGVVKITTIAGSKLVFDPRKNKRPDLPPELKQACDKHAEIHCRCSQDKASPYLGKKIPYDHVHYDDGSRDYNWANQGDRVVFVTNNGQKHLV